MKLGKEIKITNIVQEDEKAELTKLAKKGFAGRHYLICDGIINTGSTMNRVRDFFLTNGAASVQTLSVFVRNKSRFIPNYYAMMIGQTDDIIFSETMFPSDFYHRGIIRIPTINDCGSVIETDTNWIDGPVDAYIYNSLKDRNSHTYVIESDEDKRIVGILHFKIDENLNAFLDVLAIDKKFHGKKYGMTLLLFFMSFCRFNNVRTATLYAPRNRQTFYEENKWIPTGKSVKFKLYGIFYEMKHYIIPEQLIEMSDQSSKEG
jgi:hypoxanthine phosphoribosyltransferase